MHTRNDWSRTLNEMIQHLPLISQWLDSTEPSGVFNTALYLYFTTFDWRATSRRREGCSSFIITLEGQRFRTCLLGSVVVRAFASRSGGCGFKPHPGQYFWLVVNCATIKTYTHSAISKCKNTCLLSKQQQLKLEKDEKSQKILL